MKPGIERLATRGPFLFGRIAHRAARPAGKNKIARLEVAMLSTRSQRLLLVILALARFACAADGAALTQAQLTSRASVISGSRPHRLVGAPPAHDIPCAHHTA